MDPTQITALLSQMVSGAPNAPSDPAQMEPPIPPEPSQPDPNFRAPSSVNLGLPINIVKEIERYSQRREGIDDLIEKSRAILNTDPRQNREDEFKKTWAGKHPILSVLHSVLVGAGGMPEGSARNMAMSQIDKDLAAKKASAQQVLQTVLGEARLNKSEYDTNIKQSNEQFNQWMKEQGLTQADLKRQLEAQRMQINADLAKGRLDQNAQKLALDTLYRNAQIEAMATKASLPSKAEWADHMIREGKWKQKEINNWLGASDRPGPQPTTRYDQFGNPIGGSSRGAGTPDTAAGNGSKF